MITSQLVRDASKVHDCLREVAGDRLVAVKPVKIYIPAIFADSDLAVIGSETYIVGIYAIVTEDGYYGVSTINAMMAIEPTTTNRVQIDGDEYFEFVFDAGATVITKLQLVKTNTIVYRIFSEIISKGRVPWYLGYRELGSIFKTAQKHAGANVGQNHEVDELMVSIIARDPNDRNKGYRQMIKQELDLSLIQPVFIPLRSVQYAASNTLNKLAGSYFHQGMVSALVNPSERVERLESLLTK